MSGARTKRAKRLEKVFDIVSDLQEHTKEVNDLRWARQDGRHDWFWLAIPVSKSTRDDSPLAVSNFRVAERLIDDVSPFGTAYRFDSWPGGQIKTLMVRADDAAALRVVEGIVNSLNDYPVLDDMDFSEEEWEQNHPSESECYSEYDCCTKCQECDNVMREDMVDQVFEDHSYSCSLHPDNVEE